MMLVICADVLLRNVRLIPGVYSVAWANEVTEYMLYLITLLVALAAAPRQHIRIDILLRVIPRSSRGTANGCRTCARSPAAS